MSYDVYIYHRDAAVDEDDDVGRPPLGAENLTKFLQRLANYGYRAEGESAGSGQFIKHVDGCPIQVTVFLNEIAFSVPYWENAEAAIFEALQDATELGEEFDEWVAYDPQAE